MRARFLVFTDLDGTLLDHASYDHGPARGALSALAARSIPVIPNTSKTAAEMDVWRRRLDLDGPFVVENGSAVFLPDTPDWRRGGAAHVTDAGWITIVFGETIESIRAILADNAMAARFDYAALSHMTPDEVAAATGLDRAAAARAQTRQYSEPLLWRDTEPALATFADELQPLGLRVTRGGRFVHVMGRTDKGVALRRTAERYVIGTDETLCTIALGDSPNDAEMLNAADIPVIVHNPHSTPPSLTRAQVLRTRAAGPAGWQEALDELFESRIR